MSESFAPSIKTKGGRTITPKGYEWILGFALGGCQWAIDIANDPEFKQRVRDDLLKEKKIEYENQIEYLENQIKNIFEEIDKLEGM